MRKVQGPSKAKGTRPDGLVRAMGFEVWGKKPLECEFEVVGKSGVDRFVVRETQKDPIAEATDKEIQHVGKCSVSHRVGTKSLRSA